MQDGGWEEVTDPNEMKSVLGVEAARQMSGGASPGTGRKLSPQEQKYLNDLREQGASGANALSQYQKAAAAIERSEITPYRAAQIESTIPQEGSGFSAGQRWNRFIYGVDDQEVSDFQYLNGLTSAQVLDRQMEQKGPQTESDAARLKLTEISPFKSQAANAEVIGDGVLRSRMLAGKAPFYTRWANRYGLNGLDPQGRSADDVWLNALDEAQTELRTKREARAQTGTALSADDLAAYRRLAARGASPEKLRNFVRERTGGELVNADAVANARDRGAGVRTDVQYEGFTIKRVK